MACFYAMEELDVTFDTDVLFQNAKNKDVMDVELVEKGKGIKAEDGTEIKITPPKFKINDEVFPKQMYTLRVCKRCRGEWLEAVESWFNAQPEGEDGDADEPEGSSIGSGIFVRRNGRNVEITEEEWYKNNPGREPVRAVEEGDNK